MENEEEVFRKVKAALTMFFQKEKALLDNNASERSISHKLAEHLQQQFPLLKVDCEYNRHGDAIKKLQYGHVESISTDDLEAKTVFPDIVVHKRGNDESNLLVIEIKKSNSGQHHGPDQEKLKAFTGNQYRYEVGLFLLLDMDRGCLGNVRCFKGGVEVNETMWANLKELGYGV
jgi:hypothetical protein